MSCSLLFSCLDGKYQLHAWQKLYMESDTIQLMLSYDLNKLNELNDLGELNDKIGNVSKLLIENREIIPMKCKVSEFHYFIQHFNMNIYTIKNTYIIDFLNIAIKAHNIPDVPYSFYMNITQNYSHRYEYNNDKFSLGIDMKYMSNLLTIIFNKNHDIVVEILNNARECSLFPEEHIKSRFTIKMNDIYYVYGYASNNKIFCYTTHQHVDVIPVCVHHFDCMKRYGVTSDMIIDTYNRMLKVFNIKDIFNLVNAEYLIRAPA